MPCMCCVCVLYEQQLVCSYYYRISIICVHYGIHIIVSILRNINNKLQYDEVYTMVSVTLKHSRNKCACERVETNTETSETDSIIATMKTSDFMFVFWFSLAEGRPLSLLTIIRHAGVLRNCSDPNIITINDVELNIADRTENPYYLLSNLLASTKGQLDATHVLWSIKLVIFQRNTVALLMFLYSHILTNRKLNNISVAAPQIEMFSYIA